MISLHFLINHLLAENILSMIHNENHPMKEMKAIENPKNPNPNSNPIEKTNIKSKQENYLVYLY